MKDKGNATGWSSWSLSVLLHLLVIGCMAGAWFWYRDPPPREERLAIEASVIMDQATDVVTTRAPEPVAEPVVEPMVEPVPEPEPPPPPKEDPAEKLARDAEAARVAQAERVAEQRRVAEARLAAQLKADQAAKEKADRDKKEREKAEQLKAQREREDREKADQLRKQREQADMDARMQRETDLNAQLAAEQRVAAAKSGVAGQQYIRQIAAKIERSWTRPPSATPGTQCEIRVTQIATGVVTDVKVVDCNRDETVRQSVENAVYRASPLPQPADPALFERDLRIRFRPEN